MSKKIYDLCIVGGGGAGLSAAIAARRRGISVLILERADRVGKKILATGNGRCNITNSFITPKNYHGDRNFAMSVLGCVGRDDVISLLESCGIILTEEESGKMYPQSLQATSVLDLLREELKRLEVEIRTSFFVKDIKKENGIFRIFGDGNVMAKSVLLCGGGYAAPMFGSDGNLNALAKKLGHRETPVFPALVQLKTENPLKALKGVKHFCTAHLYIDGKKADSQYGEVLFTEYGLSGPPIFSLSREASRAVMMGIKAEISLEILPEDFKTLFEMLSKRQKDLPHLGKENFLNSIVNKRIGFEITKKCDSIKEMASTLKNWKFRVAGTMGFKNAQVTAGGISCGEVCEKTMMSKKVKGLYFAGEMLDVDGDCGGYNLQFALSSGILAGMSAADERNK